LNETEDVKRGEAGGRGEEGMRAGGGGGAQKKKLLKNTTQKTNLSSSKKLVTAKGVKAPRKGANRTPIYTSTFAREKGCWAEWGF